MGEEAIINLRSSFRALGVHKSSWARARTSREMGEEAIMNLRSSGRALGCHKSSGARARTSREMGGGNQKLLRFPKRVLVGGGASSVVSKQPKLKNEQQLKRKEDSKPVLVGAATSGQQIHANPKGGSHVFLRGRGEVLEKHRWPSACRKKGFLRLIIQTQNP